MSPRRRAAVAASTVVGVVILVSVAFAAWRLHAGPAPAPVVLAAGGSTGSTASDVSSTPAQGSGASLDGTWTIDPTSGSLADATSSFAGYRINERFSGVGANTVVGRTQRVSGSLTIDGTTITALTVDVDMTTLRSDDVRRDESLGERGLETDQFPTATFSLTRPIEVGRVPAEGDQIAVHAVGDLTLHGVTNEVDVPVQAVWAGPRIEAVASVDIALADYGIDPPVGFLVLSIADNGTIELHLLFHKA